MPYVNVPNDLSKIKTKMAFNLTKRQLVCFGSAGAVGIPAYLLTRRTLGDTGAMFLMMAIMLPAFLWRCMKGMACPLKRWCGISSGPSFYGPVIRPYRTENIYAPFAGPGAGKEDTLEKHKENKRACRQPVIVRRPYRPNRPFPYLRCSRTVFAAPGRCLHKNGGI